ncbi:hypothetical protein ACPC5Q_03530 [Acinetobacter junii]|uniref:hypothetical protein n=1 Tax=Acinetobacter junii TaxID=40215 RepID=UPI003C197A91
MKERPILFSTPMVQAILSGQKTQTRRIVNKAPTTEINHRLIALNNGWNWQVDQQGIVPTMHREIDNPMVCPFGQVGDRLWVRETFASGLCTKSGYAYRATHKAEDLEEGWFETIKWTPSIHMPRTACRLILEITNIRIERLNDITSEDAKAEGFDYSTHPSAIEMGYAIGAKTNFRVTWEQIYGQNEWNKNPWVWVVEFKVIQGGAL